MSAFAMPTVQSVKNLFLKICEPLLKASWEQRRTWAILVVVWSCAFMGAAYFFQTHYYIGVDSQQFRCINARLFVVDLKKRNPERDQIFAFYAANAEPVIKDGELLAKYIRGMPGDKVTITPDEKIYVNDKLIAEGMAHLHGLNPKNARKFFGSRVLGEDEYWVMGKLPLSFDSRYYGPIKESQIRGRAYAIF